jgi:hypothetical protein
MVHPQDADGAGLHIWRVAGNILNKQSWTADKGWSCSLNIGRVLTERKKHCTKCHRVPRTSIDSLARGEVQKEIYTETGREDVDWIHLAQDRDHWRAVMNLWVQ